MVVELMWFNSTQLTFYLTATRECRWDPGCSGEWHRGAKSAPGKQASEKASLVRDITQEAPVTVTGMGPGDATALAYCVLCYTEV